ncbi:META domain-containing protein [Pedobacter sp. MC2016-14]|uniref:META domain-containing protein n=1 Tax=Pedobacter sp. MC2016-14 TaxID=2897327 RepID=UPI001E57FB31|nr:META domain-containing protein [Pedobacter sp. MC2016-14]MCD0489121.1 META domain-containing protein [Pedobacter sp. MC2016-14]
MKLTLKGSIAIIILFLFSNCSVKRKAADLPKEHANLTGTYWKLVEVAGQPIGSVNNKEPHIQLNDELKRLTGSGGCNNLSGPYVLKEPGRISFSQIISTKMACNGMETENAMLDALTHTDSFAIKGDTLNLFRARMAPLARFIAVHQK